MVASQLLGIMGGGVATCSPWSRTNTHATKPSPGNPYSLALALPLTPGTHAAWFMAEAVAPKADAPGWQATDSACAP